MKILLRSLIALILIPLVIISIHYDSLTSFILVLLVVAIAAFELSLIYSKEIKNYPVFSSTLITIIVPVILYFKFYFLIPFLILWVSLVSIFRKDNFQREETMIRLVFSALYIGFLGSFTFLLREEVELRNISIFFASFPLVLTWSSDSGAYFTGILIGRHKLAPDISPAKTWEGVLGGLFMAIVTGIFYSFFIKELHVVEWIIISVILSIMADIGDLFESIIKRRFGVKDTSPLLSVHGGVLDRIDSLLFTIPVFYFYLILR